MDKARFYTKRFVFKGCTDLKVRLRFVKTYIWNIALYECETQTTDMFKRKRIKAFEMWRYRNMLQIKWTEKIRNKKVFERIGIKREILEYDCKNSGNDGAQLLPLILERMVEGKNWRRRQRTNYDEQMMKITKCKFFSKMQKLAYKREKRRNAAN